MTLNHIGFMKEDQEIIIRREVKYVYGFILAITLLYVINILLVYTAAGDLSWKMSLFLMAGAVIPLILCGFINLFLYRRAVFPKLKDESEERINAE